MPEQETEAQFKQSFTKRVKEARKSLGWKQWQMAEALDMQQDKYKQYEGRSMLPHHLLGRFCLITHVNPEWLLTGHGKKLLKPLEIVESEAPAKPRPIRKAKPSRAA